MEFEYKVTVIIPVYNVEQYLEACLDSLLAQTIPQEEMEVLMINDGSPDGSLKICERYAAAHPNFKVISQENQGVSAARNNGIRNAKGKYLLYLDGDDTLSPETVKNVTDFFDEHYDEVDVVTYPLIYRRENGESRHWRYKYLKASGVYDLDEYPYISQTSMNVCVKNKGKDNIYFDTQLKLYEDQIYNLMQTAALYKIGYCKTGVYYYYQRQTGATKQNSHPYYEGDSLLDIFERFLLCQHGSRYSQALVLYNLNWRISSDLVYPYHFPEKELAEYKENLSRVVDQIDTELILGHPNINEAHKYFLLSLKTKDRPFFRIQRNHKTQKAEILLLDQDGQVGQNDTVLIVLGQCKIEKNSFYMLAYLKDFAFDFMDKPQLFAVLNEETYVEIPLYLSQLSCFWSKIRTNTFWGFSFEIPLDSFSTLQFVVRIEGREFKTKYWLGDRQSIQPDRKRNYLSSEHGTVFFRNNQFTVVPNTEPATIDAKKLYERYLFKNKKKQWLVRRYAHKRPGRVIWLYEDTYNAVDNAYYQFLHDFEKNDGIERYYVCDKEEIDWQHLFTPKQQKRLIPRMGRKHKRLFIQADKILVSFVGHDDFVPFDRNTILWYWDLFHFEVIYLQHGVMHAELNYMYSKEKIYMVDKIVASTQFEKKNMVNKLAFQEKDILCTGMPRLDHLEKKERQRKILFAPSWRSYLVASDAEGRRAAQANFEGTDYFQEIKAFLTDERLNVLLKEKGYKLEIKLHPNFSVYAETFAALCNESMAVVDEVTLGEYAAFITDFTSFMYDCFYLDVPVITYIFDYGRFKAGLHSYRELCWPMEEEYPYYCKDIDGVIETLKRLVAAPDDFTEAFKKYTEGMFFDREQRHADRLYDYLMESSAE